MRIALALATAAVVAAPVLAVAPSAVAADSFACVDGAPGAGDPFFPYAGNGGYRVGHYGIDISYVPATHHLVGATTIHARATENLCRFDLDFRGYRIIELRVDGARASFVRRHTQELVVRPAHPLRAGQQFTVVVRYAGTPHPVIDPDGSLDGFIPTDDGAFVAAEPQGAPSWYPCNDTPADKASFDIRVRVPAGLTAVSNGVLRSQRTAHGMTTFAWRETKPMSTYLATATIGRFEVHTGWTHSGIPFYEAVDPREHAAWKTVSQTGNIVDYYSEVFGPYPYDATGGIVDHAEFVGYSLETMTRPLYPGAPSIGTVAHELAHQWFGDSVTLQQWPDIWLHEGFATWVSWLWSEHTGGLSAQQIFDRLYAIPASNTGFWNPPPANLSQPADVFATSVYERGGLALQALRTRIGDTDFFLLLRTWAQQHRYGNATVPQFERLAEQISHQNLRHFFRVWLYQSGKPTNW